MKLFKYKTLTLILLMLITNNTLGITKDKNKTDTKTIIESSATKKILRLRTSFEDKLNSPKGKALQKFKESIETKIYGESKVDLKEEGKLFLENNELEGIELGATEFGIIEYSIMANENTKNFNLLTLPFLFSTIDDFSNFRKSELAQKMINDFNKNSNEYMILTMMGGGYKYIYGDKEFKKKEDFINSKFGDVNGNYLLDNITLKSMGVNSIFVGNKHEVLKGLKKEGRNPLNGSFITLSSINDPEFKLNDKKAIITNNKFFIDLQLFVVNKKWFENLTQDKQVIIKDSIEAMQEIYVKSYQEEEIKLKKYIESKESKFVELNEVEKKAFREIASDIHTVAMKENKDLLLMIYETIKKK